MISKERLEELIEQGATIYSVFGGLQRVGLRLYENFIKDNGLYEIDERKVEKNEAQILIGSLDSLFEIEEDAKFALRFKRIPRTEYLDLPTWEEFCGEDKFVAFIVYPYNYHLLKVGNYIYLKSFYERGGMDIFIKPLTKENYWLACELCRKLWLGE